MIRAKEGVIKALKEVVGSNVKDSVLRTSNGDFKGVENYTTYKIMPNVLEKLIKVLHYTFDFHKKS